MATELGLLGHVWRLQVHLQGNRDTDTGGAGQQRKERASRLALTTIFVCF